MSEELKPSTVPLSRVVLYKHGIGFFERRGKVSGRSRVTISCSAEQIDDMLKSLLVLNVGGGRLAQVTYDCSKTIETRLAEFGFAIKECTGLVDLIGQMKGMPVTVAASGETVAGRVIGLDETEQVVGDRVAREQALAVYTADGKFRRFALSSISSLTVEDESVASEIKQQLELLFQGIKKRDSKELTICLEEDKEREVIIAYSVPCPIWKTSYRLVFLQDGKLLIQGTAIVDNIQDEDWTNVQMALVSAAPISFIQPLYDPITPYRQTIQAQGVNSTGPVVAEREQRGLKAKLLMRQAAAEGQVARAAFESFDQGWGSAPGAPAPAMGGGLGFADMSIGDAMEASVNDAEVAATGQESGEMFEYLVDAPVTVPRDSSALIPIVNQAVDGERISLYNENRNRNFPYATVKLTNTTGLTLEAGPVTVMEDAAYAGEALLDVLKPDDSRFLPFALDQGCHVVVRSDNKRKPIWRVRVFKGFLFIDHREQMARLYHLENLAKKDKTVFIEHPVRSEFRLVGTEKPVETTQNYYRFRVELQAGESRELPVWEECDVVHQVPMDNVNYIDLAQIEGLIAQNILDRPMLEFLKQVIERREEIGELAETKRQAEVQLAQYKSDQERARENVKTLGTSSDRWRKAIDQTEDLIMETHKLLTEITVKIDRKWKEYSDFVRAELIQVLEEKVGVEG